MNSRTTSADHVFVCYAREDQDFVLKLAGNLKERGVPVWIDHWNIPVSANWEQAIEDALYKCAQFLIILSPVAVVRDEVRGELRVALDEGKPIVPVLYQDCRVPPRLRVLQHADFIGRGPDDEAGLAQVLRALGVAEAPLSEPAEPEPVTVSPPKRETVAPARQPFEPDMVLIPAGEFLMGSDPKKDGTPAVKNNLSIPCTCPTTTWPRCR